MTQGPREAIGGRESRQGGEKARKRKMGIDLRKEDRRRRRAGKEISVLYIANP